MWPGDPSVHVPSVNPVPSTREKKALLSGLERSVLNKRLTALMVELTAAHYSRTTADGGRGGPVLGLVWRQIQRAGRTDVPEIQTR